MKSERITLINCNASLLKIILSGDEHLGKELNLSIPKPWTEFGLEAFAYALKKIQSDQLHPKWFSYLPIENQTRILLGSCGYKGGPDVQGVVEIGYEVAKDYRNQGYATEITQLLINNAFQEPKVNRIQAHTLAEKNASTRVLEKCSFKFAEEISDPDDGLIWKWVLER